MGCAAWAAEHNAVANTTARHRTRFMGVLTGCGFQAHRLSCGWESARRGEPLGFFAPATVFLCDLWALIPSIFLGFTTVGARSSVRRWPDRTCICCREAAPAD